MPSAIPDLRQKLSADEMREVTQHSLPKGPFVVQGVTRQGRRLLIDVWWPETGEKVKLESYNRQMTKPIHTD